MEVIVINCDCGEYEYLVEFRYSDSFQYSKLDDYSNAKDKVYKINKV